MHKYWSANRSVFVLDYLGLLVAYYILTANVMTGIEERLHQIMEKVEILDRKISSFQLPANEQVMDDIDLQKETKVSPRTTAMWRSEGLIKYTKVGGKVMYLKS